MKGLLGADIFINLLLVFIITTGLLMMNKNRASQITYKAGTAAGEALMPKIDLPGAKNRGLPAGVNKKRVTISAKETKEGVGYFFNNTPMGLNDIAKNLQKNGISRVEIRIEGRLPYMYYITVLNLCKNAGITEIYNVYKLSQKMEDGGGK